MKNERLIFIPVETKVREFHAKILLSCYAAEAGFSVILGMQTELLRMVKFQPRGVYVEKGVAPQKIPGTRLLKGLGNKVVAWCEEGLIIVDQETYARDRVSSEVFSMLDLFFAWGKVNAGAIRQKMGSEADKVVITGNPRFDLLREPHSGVFSSDAQKLKRKHGRFLLINTNFGLFNNFFGPDYFIEKVMRPYGRIRDANHEKFLKDWVSHVGMVYEKFIDLMPVLSRNFPGHKIVLRPHPSENHDNWKKEVRGLANVEVIHKGSVIPWILASDVLVHNSCTTGVEAHVLGKPVVAYRPVRSDLFEFELPSVVSIPAFTANETVDRISEILDGKDREAPNAVISRDYAVNISGSFACQAIVRSLADFFERTSFENASGVKAAATKLRWRLKDFLYDTKVAVNRAINRKQEDAEYMKQKIPGIELHEVIEVIKSFQKAGCGFSRVGAERMRGTEYCFRITAK
ncbi:MAG: hypothetical protein KAI35_10160 [Desulfobulbaceae bacterium]|nr:hypothetical protein [Desulfobulbaceae bacterium]